MFIPTKEAFYQMSPTEFEEYCLQILREQFEGAQDLLIEHNVKEQAPDGTYQLDGKIYFTQGNIAFNILVECKHYKSNISREKIEVLNDKIRALNAQKGIFISCSNFQKGAITFAAEHKIALIQIVPAETTPPQIKVNQILNKVGDLYNYGKPYIGVLQSYGEGITCSYLCRKNKKLYESIIQAE